MPSRLDLAPALFAVMFEAASRAVVANAFGEPIRLTLYDDIGSVAVVELDAIAAV